MTSALLDDAAQALIAAATAARELAYAPYSTFQVGAAMRLSDGSIVVGSNIENASYGLSMCAERTALYRALGHGRPTITALAVVGPPGAPCAPCGACRQVLAEFLPSDATICFPGAQGMVTIALRELLPFAFQLP